jgi:hypothetical protein
MAHKLQIELMKLPKGLAWVHCSNGEVPRHAVKGGWDGRNNDHFYIGRCGHKGDVVPGKVSRKDRCLYIPSGNKEHKYSNYEVLVTESRDVMLEWVAYSGGYVPPGAIPGGANMDDHEPFYIGRTIRKHKGDTIPGKISAKQASFYYSSGNDEHRRSEYEVLTLNDPDYYEISDMKYDLHKATQAELPPESIDVMVATNKSKHSNKVNLGKSVAATSSSNWGHQVGIKVGVEAGGKIGVPFVAEGEIKVSADLSYQHTWGSTQSDTQEANVSCSVDLPPRTQSKCTVLVRKAKIDVPYTADVRTYKAGQLDRSFHTSGVYHGVAVCSFEIDIGSPKPLS